MRDKPRPLLAKSSQPAVVFRSLKRTQTPLRTVLHSVGGSAVAVAHAARGALFGALLAVSGDWTPANVARLTRFEAFEVWRGRSFSDRS